MRVFAMVYVDCRQIINILYLAIKSSTIVVYSASMKSYQYLNYDILEKIQLYGYFYVSVSGQRQTGLNR